MGGQLAGAKQELTASIDKDKGHAAEVRAWESISASSLEAIGGQQSRCSDCRQTQPASVSPSACKSSSAQAGVLSICLTLSLNLQQNKHFRKLKLCQDGLFFLKVTASPSPEARQHRWRPPLIVDLRLTPATWLTSIMNIWPIPIQYVLIKALKSCCISLSG